MSEPMLRELCASKRHLEDDLDHWMRARFKICLTHWNDVGKRYSAHFLVAYAYCCIML